MKFGVREICDVVFKAKSDVKIGSKVFKKGQPVLYIDTAKTSTLEGAATTVYATGGKGNPNLIAWEGEKTLTFTVEDALLSPIGFSILSGAGVFNGSAKTSEIHAHQTYSTTVNADGTIDLASALGADEKIDATAPIFAVIAEEDGSITGDMLEDLEVETDGKSLKGADAEYATKKVFVDYYVVKKAADVTELQIEAGTFAGNYYVEASTLFRRQDNGKDLPAEITIPNAKIQSNFTFNMAATGDPSTFSFTMDAFPGYTLFDNTKKVLCVIQVIDESQDNSADIESVMSHKEGENLEHMIGSDIASADDSKTNAGDIAEYATKLDELAAKVTDITSATDANDALAQLNVLVAPAKASWGSTTPVASTTTACDVVVTYKKQTKNTTSNVTLP